MCLEAAQTNSIADQAPVFGAEAQLRETTLDNAFKNTPEKIDFSPTEFNDMIADFTLLNEFREENLEKELNPERAAARKEVEAQILEDLEGPNDELREEFIKAGLRKADAVGAEVGGQGTAGNDIVERVLGSNHLRFRDASQLKALGFLGANPRLAQGADAGQLAAMDFSVKTQNTDIENQFRQQLNNIAFLGMNNQFGANQRLMQAAAEEVAQNQRSVDQASARQLELVKTGIEAMAEITGSALGGGGGGAAMSSAAIKENVVPWEGDALALLDELQVCTYDRTDTGNKGEIGLIAEKCPKFMQVTLPNGVLGVSHYAFESVLLKALQQLKERIQ